MAELRRCAWSPDCCSIPPEGQRYCTRHSPEGAPHGVREQSALELLETHAKALEAENERLRGDLAICRQLNASEYGKACAENERLTRERDRLHKQLLEHAEVCGESAYPISDRVAVETPEKLWYIECNKCGRQDNPGYGCNALQPDGTRCNGTMRRTRLLFESNFGTPPDPRPAVETSE